MTKHTLFPLTVTAVLLGSTAVFSDAADDLAAQLAAQGYTDIEIDRGSNTNSVEGKGPDGEVEYTLDAATGAVLSQEFDADDESDDDEEDEDDEDEDEDEDDEDDDEDEDDEDDEDEDEDEDDEDEDDKDDEDEDDDEDDEDEDDEDDN